MLAADLLLERRYLKPGGVRGTLVAEIPAALQKARFLHKVSVGAFSYLNVDTTVYHAEIGRYVSCAHRVMIAPTEHPVDWMTSHPFSFGDRSLFQKGAPELNAILTPNSKFNRYGEPARIGNDVWIGYGAFVRQGVTVGDGAIIAAGSVVVTDVPPYAIVAGSPARVKRMRFDDDLIARFQRVKWWRYDLNSPLLKRMDYSDPVAALDRIEAAADQLPLLTPRLIKFVERRGKVTASFEDEDGQDPAANRDEDRDDESNSAKINDNIGGGDGSVPTIGREDRVEDEGSSTTAWQRLKMRIATTAKPAKGQRDLS